MPSGIILTSLGSFDDEGRSVKITSDGFILVGGTSFDGSDSNFALVRYKSSGLLDTAFGGGAGFVTTDFSFTDIGSAIALQTDGRTLLGGTASNGSTANFALLRYTT